MGRSGRITKRSDGTVRTLLYEAANVLLLKISRTSPLREWGLAIAQRNGFEKAKVAVTRKLAVLLYRLWRDGTEFRWNEGGPRSDLAHHFATLTQLNANQRRPTASIS